MGNLPGLWIEEGLAQGVAQGLAQGLAQGVAQERARSLVRVLERRFGTVPSRDLDRIGKADAATLDAWFDRALDADSLDAVFH